MYAMNVEKRGGRSKRDYVPALKSVYIYIYVWDRGSGPTYMYRRTGRTSRRTVKTRRVLYLEYRVCAHLPAHSRILHHDKLIYIFNKTFLHWTSLRKCFHHKVRAKKTILTDKNQFLGSSFTPMHFQQKSSITKLYIVTDGKVVMANIVAILFHLSAVWRLDCSSTVILIVINSHGAGISKRDARSRFQLNKKSWLISLFSCCFFVPRLVSSPCSFSKSRKSRDL